MGVLNVTPDSFSDGGQYLGPTAAAERAKQMIADGADTVDVGPESTRPGAEPVPAAEQIARALPVIEAIQAVDAAITVSIDTRVAAVAEAALDAGATMINDVSALRDDPELGPLAASRGVPVVLMHMRGTPPDMQHGGGPQYDDVVGEVCDFLTERRAFAESCGIARQAVILDPGIGFGKRVEHNLELLRRLDRLVSLGSPVLVGASRKRFIGHLLGIDDPARRVTGSIACALMAAQSGAAYLRVHDVKETVEALTMWSLVAGEQAIE